MLGIPFVLWLWIRRILITFTILMALVIIVSKVARSPIIAKVEPQFSTKQVQEIRAAIAANYHHNDNNDNATTIVIVGAGAAGLMAGYTLKYLGIHNVILLEASDTFGGRTLELSNFVETTTTTTTTSYGSATTTTTIPLDLGAEWIHYHPRILQDLLLFDNNNDNNDNENIFQSQLPKTIDYWPQTYDTPYGSKHWARFFYQDYKFFNTTWYSYFRDFIVPYIQHDNIYTNTPVTMIDYSNEQHFGNDNENKNKKNKPIQIITNRKNHQDGTHHSMMFHADKVIVATPVSILQNLDDLMTFVPPLPIWKQNAIQAVEFAPGLKVWMEFTTRFFADMVYPGRIIQSIAQDQVYFDALFGKQSLLKEEDQKHVLALFEVGPKALDHVHLSSDEEIVSNLLQELDEIYNGQATKYYTGKYHVQNWSQQPYIQGAYSYNWRELYKLAPTLQMPVTRGDTNQDDGDDDEPLIYFAGEYTHPDYPASVTGAALSGRQAAYRLVKDLLK